LAKKGELVAAAKERIADQPLSERPTIASHVQDIRTQIPLFLEIVVRQFISATVIAIDRGFESLRSSSNTGQKGLS